MSKVWGGVGAWALDAERAEAEEQERAASEASNPPVLAGQPAQSFPSLKEAASTKSKKKKTPTMTLAEFNTGAYPGPGGGRRDVAIEPKGLTHDEMLRLPTGPRERSADEIEQGRLGGGFRSYGHGGGPRGGGAFSGGGRRSDDGDGRRGFGGGFDDEPRRGPPSRGSDFDQPSRADEVDNWAAGKKSSGFGLPSGDSGRSDRYSMLGTGGSSRADDVDNWSAGKKAPPVRNSSFGSGFRESSASPSDSDRWIRGGGSGGSGFSNNGDRGERPRLVLDPPKGSVGAPVQSPVKTRPSPFGAARPREEVLAEKGVDWRKMESEIEVKTSRPTSSHSSRPSSAQSSRPGSPGSQTLAAGVSNTGGAIKQRQKVNPFGDAKPREVILEEKGKDWKKIDQELEHRRVNRPETQEEKMLKEELRRLRETLIKESKGNLDGESAQFSADELKGLLLQKERELESLTREFDDKVRFGQKATIDVRPGSGSGRTVSSFDRPPSQIGISEEPRITDYGERPRSRGGMGDQWSKPVDDRRFQIAKERGFPGNRNMDRSKSRERW
ncbi:putative plant specific eukaryotic initiation factor 4B [Dioscorea sansibarensis]